MAYSSVGSSLLNRLYPKSTTVADYGTNLLETPGHRIVIDLSIEGYESSSLVLTNTTLESDDYFVVINADNAKMHHVGKITDVSVYDGDKLNIDFTPALKENIAYGTKVTIYKGADIAGAGANVSTLVAVGYGLLGSDSIDRNGNYVEVSAPTFYFYKDLEPDTKYVALKQTNIIGVQRSVFKTAPVTSNFIVDKSFYTQNAYIVDNNKIGDEAATKVNYAQYDGTTGNYTLDVTTWGGSCKNYDFKMVNKSSYISPITSPNKNQYIGNLMNVNLNRSITNKGNMAEVKFIDPERMLERKIHEYENFNIKEVIGKERTGHKPIASLPGTYNGSSSTITVTNLTEGQDLKLLLGSAAAFELIYIGDYYYKLSAIGNVVGSTQTLTVSDRRLSTAFKFEGSSTVATMTDERAYRNIWSSKVNNLIVRHDIDTIIDSGTLKRNGLTLTEDTESDINGLEYIFVGSAVGGITFTAKKGDNRNNYVELNDTIDSSYLNNVSLLNSIKGDVIVNKKVFKGKVEYIETDTEGGVFSLTISGRDEIATLLSYPINKNFLYSKEWVASTISPVTDSFINTGLNVSTGSTGSINANVVEISSSTLTTNLDFGDVLYVSYDSKYTPIGVAAQKYNSGTAPLQINLLNDCLIDLYSYFNGNDALDTTDLYVGKNKLLAGKSLHNHYRTTPHVSLYGSADKGMIFYGTANTITTQTLSVDSCVVTNGDATVTCSGSAIKIGMMVTHGNNGLGSVASINTGIEGSSVTSFELSADFTGTGASSQTLIFTEKTNSADILSLNGTDKNHGMDITGIAALEGSSDSPKDSPYGLDFDYRIVGSLANMHIIGNPIDIEDNIMDLEIGNISPIVLARMDLNDVQDTFYTNGIGLYFLNKQGIDRGGFIHLLDHTNDTENKGSTWRRLCVDDRKTASTSSPTVNNYAFRFGSPIFRFTNFSDTKLKGLRSKIDNRSNSNKISTGRVFNTYYFDKPSQFSAYATALRAMGNEAVSKTRYKDYTNSHQKENSIERTWRYPTSGSLHQDILIYDHTHHNKSYNFSNRIADLTNALTNTKQDKMLFELDDPMCNPLFLFAPGDMLPDSQKRPDNIFFNGSDSLTRNTSDYFLLVKYKDTYSETGILHDDYTGNTKLTNLSDNNYDLLPINNNITAPRRFNLLRLKPVTYDSYWNEVDFETIINNNNYGTPEVTDVSIPASRGKPVAQTVPVTGYSVYKVATTTATTDNIYIDITTTVPLLQTFDNSSDTTWGTDGTDGGNLDGVTTHSVNIYLFTDPASDALGYSRYIGTVNTTHASNTATRIYLSSFPTSKIIGYSGEILTVETDVEFTSFNAGANILKNNNEFKYPIIVDPAKPNNHNIHSVNGLNFAATVGITSGADQVDVSNEDAPKVVSTSDVDCADVPTNFMTSGGTVGTAKFTVESESDAYIRFDTSANANTGGSVTGNKAAIFDYNNSDLMLNYRQQNLFRGGLQYKHKGNVKFVNRVSNNITVDGDVYDTIDIEFEALSGVTIDLTNHFQDGDTIDVDGVDGGSSHVNNTTYVVVDADEASNRVQLRPTSDTLAVGDTSSYESTVIIVNKSRMKINTNCHPNRFIHNLCRPTKDLIVYKGVFTNESRAGATGNYSAYKTASGIFAQMEAVIISGKGTKKENQEGDRDKRSSRRDLLNSDSFINMGKHQQDCTSSSARINTGATYSVGHTSAMVVDTGNPEDTFAIGDTIWADISGTDTEVGTVTALSSTSVTVGGGIKVEMVNNEYLKYKVTSDSTHQRGYYDLIDFPFEIFGGATTAEDKEDLMFLFRPEIKLNSKIYNTDLYQGVLSKYTDEGFVRIEIDVDLDHKDSQWASTRTKWIDFVPNLGGKVLVNKLGTVMHNILRHTISKNETGVGTNGAKTVHYLHIDNYSGWDLNTGDDATSYNLYEFASTVTTEDKLIYPLYNLSQTNIINPHTNKFFTSDINHISNKGWLYDDTDQLASTGTPHNGILKGMYVVAELDGVGSPSLIHKNDTYLFHATETNPKFKHEIATTIYMTDGEEKLKTTMTPRFYKSFNESSNKVVLEFTGMKNFKGSPSIGDIFNLTVQGSIKKDVEYVKIVTPFNIAPEVEQAVDQILGENDIPYTVSSDTNKYYAGNNFTGEDSYNAANKLLQHKDLKLHILGDTIKVVSNEEDKDFRSIEISEEDSLIKVVQIKKDKSLLDNFNEIIVYGDGFKGQARNYSNIKKIGKKRSKEIFDYSIITQAEVDRQAIKLLKLYNETSDAIELTIANDLPLLEPGNIISMYYPSEGITRQPYTVIEIIKSLGMPTKLLLGQYNKDLSNTLAGILSITKDLLGNTKRKTYVSAYVPNINIQKTKLKFVQAKVTTNTGTYTTGFGYTIGFDRVIEL